MTGFEQGRAAGHRDSSVLPGCVATCIAQAESADIYVHTAIRNLNTKRETPRNWGDGGGLRGLWKAKQTVLDGPACIQSRQVVHLLGLRTFGADLRCHRCGLDESSMGDG